MSTPSQLDPTDYAKPFLAKEANHYPLFDEGSRESQILLQEDWIESLRQPDLQYPLEQSNFPNDCAFDKVPALPVQTL